MQNPEAPERYEWFGNCSYRPAFFIDTPHSQHAMHVLFTPKQTFTFTALAAVLLTGCGGAAPLTSSTPGKPVVVDAQLNEWGGKLKTLSSKDGLLTGIQNDDDYLYLSLSTRNVESIGSIMRAGLIIWVDAAGGKEKTFGIRFPLGLSMDETGDRRLGQGAAADRVRIERSTREVEIIGADGQAIRRRKDSIPGIAAAVEADQGVLTYEIQLPLAHTDGVLYAIGTKPGQKIGVGIATPDDFVVNAAQQPGFGGLPGGRMASAEGRGYQGVPQRGFGISTFKEWMLVTLAE